MGGKLQGKLLAGWTALILVFLYLPILLLVAYSFNSSRLNILWEGFTLHWYAALWEDHSLMRALQNSLVIAAVTTVVSLFLGTAGAWLLHRYRFPFLRLFQTLILFPMIIPEVIIGISLIILFATIKTFSLGIVGEALSEQLFGLGFTTVIISHVTFCFPFVLVAIQARLAGLDPALEEAALDLGATPWQAFSKVILPYLSPAIISGGLMAFTLSLDELIVTYFTASGDSKTLPLEIYGRVKKGLSPSINAISAIFIVTTVVLVIIAEHLRRSGNEQSVKSEA